MKAYLLKAFDIANFQMFRPGPAGFTTEEAAKAYIDARNAEQNHLFFGYDEVIISEMSAEELKKANESVTVA